MNKLLAATALVLATATTSYAADMRMPAKAPPAYVAPMWNWTGFYAGLHGGYGWADVGAAGISGTGDLDGWFGGGQIGYNWQAPGSNFVFGIEADLSGADISSSATATGGGVTFTDTAKLESFGTIRGRIGVAVWERSLAYVTGGWAWGNGNFSVSAAIPALGVAAAASSSQTHNGWVLGGGLETAINQNWTWGVEYQHISFDSQTYFGALSVDSDVDTVRLKLNYLFH
jgi:outer membrane immunogenic protein